MGNLYLGAPHPGNRSPGYGYWDGYLEQQVTVAPEDNGPGESTTWQDPDTGERVTHPTFTFDRKNYCREFWKKVYTTV